MLAAVWPLRRTTSDVQTTNQKSPSDCLGLKIFWASRNLLDALPSELRNWDWWSAPIIDRCCSFVSRERPPSPDFGLSPESPPPEVKYHRLTELTYSQDLRHWFSELERSTNSTSGLCNFLEKFPRWNWGEGGANYVTPKYAISSRGLFWAEDRLKKNFQFSLVA